MKFFISTLLFSSLFLSFNGFAEVNLEDQASSFVLKTKQIQIPEYPDAFNPSIIQWENKILLSFRSIPKDSKINPSCSSAQSLIGLIFLDADFNPLNTPQIIDFCWENAKPEDARLIKVANKLYLIYSDNRDEMMCTSGFRMYITEILIDNEIIAIGNTDAVLHFEGENKNRREKNWVPFDYDGYLLMAYSLQEHKVLYPIPRSNEAATISCTHSNVSWNFGELRGGTPALLDGDEYLAFFHSSMDMSTVHSEGQKIPHYFMGAYTFNKEPPFEITKVSNNPIISLGFYEGKQYAPYWHPVKVVFPCGFIATKRFVYVSYGRQDHEIWLVKLDKQGLKESLIPVQ